MYRVYIVRPYGKSVDLITNDLSKARKRMWELECKGATAYYE